MRIRDAIVITRMEAKGSDGWVREALEICARVASEASKRNGRRKTMKKKTGSTAMFMTYGKYLEMFPKGRKNADAKADEYGYCIIDNADKSNICWLSIEAFNGINNGFKALAESEANND